MSRFCIWALGLFSLLYGVSAHASIGLVIGEPFGSFGTMMPVGHAGIYLDHICADTPTQLRPCHPGEYGVVLSRYHDLKARNLDWLATPLIPFLYGVDDPTKTPTTMTPSLESELRENYRKAHMQMEVPDVIDKAGRTVPPPYGDWEESIGAAFDRRLLVYVFDTTPEQDAQILAVLQADPNRRRYTLGRANCADFAAGLLNVVLPGVLHKNFFGDFDMITPKSLALQLEAYGRRHPEANVHAYVVPQVSGTLRRSRPLRGSAETFIMTKRYFATLLVIQPEALLADWALYETKDRGKPGKNAVTLSPNDWLQLRPQGGSQIANWKDLWVPDEAGVGQEAVEDDAREVMAGEK